MFRTALLTAVVVFQFLIGFSAEASELPNIVLFLSDDHTITDSSVYGSTDLPTPNMERLANTGMTFTQAFVASPSCAPSRAAMLTGLMPSRNGAEPNHSRPAEEIKKFPAYFQEAGYEVVSFGKVGHYRQTPEYGFDLARHFNYHEDIAIEEAAKWLKQRDSDKPLCLFVGTNWPHVPWPPEVEGLPAGEMIIPEKHVTTQDTINARKKYYAAVKQMDDELGLIYDTAKEVLGEDVMFVHTSDHGAQWPFAKWNLYDSGIRTPLIVSWPGKIEAGTKTDAMVSWIDLLPTLLEAAKLPEPENIDGKSFLPVLIGESQKHRKEIFTVHSGDGSMNVFPSRSIRTPEFKYILNLYPEFYFESHVTKVVKDTNYWPSWMEKAKTDAEAAQKVQNYLVRPPVELYDLKADPEENNNLAENPAFQPIQKHLHDQLLAWMKSQGDTKTVFGMPHLRPLKERLPNIVMVLIDDMGWNDLSCFGGTEVRTEHIDRIAAQGIRFTQFYVNSPICSPSRTALTTGHYPARHHITSYLSNREMNDRRGMAQWLDVEAPTFPRMLKQMGYATGHFGKWHMGGQRDVGEAPLITEYGFDQSITNFEGLGHRILPLKDAYNGKPARRHALGSDQLGRGPIEWADRSLITARFVQQADQFIEEALRQDKPFYVNVWPDDVHSPFFPPAARRGDEAKRTLYHGVLETMDEQLGVLFDRIVNTPKLKENTLIILCSDNGPEPGAGVSTPLRSTKGSLFEGGIRSPLIVWGPGYLNPNSTGTSNDTTVMSSVDLIESLIDWMQPPTPEGYQSDGEELMGALLGYSTAERRTPLYWRRPPDRPGTKADPWPDLAVRDKKWKLLCNADGKQVQLYNLQVDPEESNNITKNHPRITNRLKQQLLEWNQSMPQDKPFPIGKKK